MNIVHVILFVVDLLVSLAALLAAYFFYRHGSDLAVAAAFILVYLAGRTTASSFTALRAS